jgi:hypothetical protein
MTFRIGRWLFVLVAADRRLRAGRPGLAGVRENVSFSILEGYDKGNDLAQLARDFER